MIPEGGYPFGAIPVIWIISAVLVVVIGLSAVGIMAYLLTRADSVEDSDTSETSEPLK